MLRTLENLCAVATLDHTYCGSNETSVGQSARWHNGSTLRALLVDFYGTLVQDDDVVVGEDSPATWQLNWAYRSRQLKLRGNGRGCSSPWLSRLRAALSAPA